MAGRVLCAAALLLGAACAPSSPLDGAPLDRLAALAAQVDAQRLESSLRSLVDEHLQDQPWPCPAHLLEQDSPYCHLTHARARQRVIDELEALGYQVTLHRAGSGDTEVQNVVVELPGQRHPEQVVMVGAHFDAFYAAADDNTSGLVGLLEIARLLATQRFARTLRLVGFDLEELANLGSLPEAALPSDGELEIFLCLDMLGYYDEAPGSQTVPAGTTMPSAGTFVAAIANARSRAQVEQMFALNQALELADFGVALAPGDGQLPLLASFTRSDHQPYWLADQAAIFFTDTAELRNPNYHRPDDTPDTLDYPRYRRAVQLALASVALWAELEE